jgi:hypothetical protein
MLPPELLPSLGRLTVHITERSLPSRAGRSSPHHRAPSSIPKLRHAVRSSCLATAHRRPSLFSRRSASLPAGPTAPRLSPSQSRSQERYHEAAKHRLIRFASACALELCHAPSQGRPKPPSPRSPNHSLESPSHLDLEPMVRTSILPLAIGADASLAALPSAVCVSTSASPTWSWASQLRERAAQCRTLLLCCWDRAAHCWIGSLEDVAHCPVKSFSISK